MKSKKKRPSLQDAHDYAKGGNYGFSAEDYITSEEKEKMLDEFTELLENRIKKELPRSRRLDLTILKCHIIVEFALNKFIEFKCQSTIDIGNERFTFADKITLAYMLGLIGHPTIIPSIELLNKLRNDVAHKLIINTPKIDELLRINSDHYESFKSPSDAERLRGIKNVTYGICGFIMGVTQSHVYSNISSKPS